MEAMDRKAVCDILMSLANSSLAIELQAYRGAIAAKLGLDEGMMDRVFRFETFAYFVCNDRRERSLGGRPLSAWTKMEVEEVKRDGGDVVVEQAEQQVAQVVRVKHVEMKEEFLTDLCSARPKIRIPTEELGSKLPAKKVVVKQAEKVEQAVEKAETTEQAEQVMEQAEQAEKVVEQAEQVEQVEQVAEQVAETEPPKEEVDSTEDDATPKNKDPSAKALRKLMRRAHIPRKGLTIDTTTYKKAVMLKGNTKPYRNALRDLKGRWNGSLKAWVFSKDQVQKQAKDQA